MLNQLPLVVTGSLNTIAIDADAATLAALLAGVVVLTAGGKSPGAAKRTLSIASPSSLLVALRSSQRTHSDAPGARLKPLMLPEIAVRFGAVLPSSLPTVPAFTGAVKSSRS